MRRHVQQRTGGPGGRALVVIVIVAVLVTLTGLVAWRWGRVAAPQTNVARETADRFLSQIRAGDFKAAWESTTTDFKSDEGLESFAAHARARAFLKGELEFIEMKEVQVFGLTRWECIYRPKSQPGTNVRVLIGNEQDAWHVEQLRFE